MTRARAVFALAPFAAVLATVPLADAQVGPNPLPVLSAAHSIAFDVSGKNVNGDPTAIEAAELVFLKPDGTAATRVEVPASVGTVTIPMEGVLGALTGVHKLTARVKGANGLWSVPSTPLDVKIDNVAPETVVEIRIIIQIGPRSP